MYIISAKSPYIHQPNLAGISVGAFKGRKALSGFGKRHRDYGYRGGAGGGAKGGRLLALERKGVTEHWTAVPDALDGAHLIVRYRHVIVTRLDCLVVVLLHRIDTPGPVRQSKRS